MMIRATCCALLLALLLAAPHPAPANEVARAVTDLQDGKLRFSFPAKPGVYGDGRGIYIHGRNHATDDDWVPDCDPCPVQITLTVREGAVRGFRSRVGGRWTSRPHGLRDLGAVPASVATTFLMSLATQASDDVAEEALSAAALADEAEIWPQLLEFTRDRSRSRQLRETALFWLGQAAQDAVAEELQGLIHDGHEDLELRKHAVFVLSQRADSVPLLMRIARQNPNAEIRQSALFWLAQDDSPGIVDFFEEILRKK